MEDTFSPHFFTKGGSNRYLLSGGNEYVQLAHYKGSNGSTRTDNTEKDWFENTTLKTNYETGDWKFVSVSPTKVTDFFSQVSLALIV